jgi:hypothetical protein
VIEKIGHILKNAVKFIYIQKRGGLGNVIVRANTEGSPCLIDFRGANHGGLSITRTSVKKRPTHGALRAGKLTMTYSPNAGYSGIDQFDLRICGTVPDDSFVCLPFHFLVEVRY